MAKRVEVKFVKHGYSGLDECPIGHVFKAVWHTVADVPDIKCVYIRGSSLTKATGHKTAWQLKQYLFVLGTDHSEMELVNE